MLLEKRRVRRLKMKRWKKVLVLTLAMAVMANGMVFAAQQKAAPVKKVSINKASAAELATLPGIGPKKAQRIVETRRKLGGFRKLRDLLKVKGIGEKTFKKLLPYITL